MVTLDQALDTVMELLPEQREMLVEILQKRQIENRRKEIARNAQEAIRAFHADKLQPQSAREIIAELRNALNDERDE